MQGSVPGWFRTFGLLLLLPGIALAQAGLPYEGSAALPPGVMVGPIPAAPPQAAMPLPYPATDAMFGAPYQAVWNDAASEPGVQLAKSLPPILPPAQQPAIPQVPVQPVAAQQELVQPAPNPPGELPPAVPQLDVAPVPETIAAEVAEDVEAIIEPSAPVPAVKLWEGNVELGINGTSGNSETFNLRAGAQAKRKTERSQLTLLTTYLQNTSEGDVTANRNFSEARHEWLNRSRWTPYVHGLLEYDEFRNFDLRLTADAGIGYQFIKNDTTNLLARAGFGGSKEFGSPDDDFKPEAVFGAEFSHQISARQSLEFNVDYYPSVEDLNDFRINSVLNWVFVLDETNNLSLKLGIIDRYDSTPSGARYNDIDYSLLLLWAF